MTTSFQAKHLLGLITAVVLSCGLLVFSNEIRQFESLGYLGIFVLSFLGNATLILPAPALVLVFTMGATMPSPLVVGILAGIGAALGEITGYLAGYSGSGLIATTPAYQKMKTQVNRFGLLVIFLLALIPNPLFDLAGLAAGALNLKWWKFLGVTAVGKIIKSVIVAYAGFFMLGQLPASLQPALPTLGEWGSESTLVESPTPSPAQPKLLFLGDLMYDRHIRQFTQEHGARWPLEPLEPLLQDHDAVIATLEGPITSAPSTSQGSVPGSPRNFIFTFPLETASALAEQGAFILNIGNNHIFNQGKGGVESTKMALTNAGLHFFGWTSLETQPSERVYITSIQGTTFAFVNFNQFASEGFETAVQDVQWAETQPNVAATIVVPHWGNEYQPVANQVIRDWATELITAGADLIVGSHPHVVQDFAEIKGVPVYFSLGNTVFDQYFSAETMHGLAVSATFDPVTKKWQFVEYPLAIGRDGQTKLQE